LEKGDSWLLLDTLLFQLDWPDLEAVVKVCGSPLQFGHS
jgi:hypothetical protein